MKIKRVRVQNFRVHSDKQVDFSPGVNAITGLNGSGKTSLVEAIYIALRGSSFKTGDDKIIKSGTEWYRVDIDFEDGNSRIVKFTTGDDVKKKIFEIDGKNYSRLPASKKLPIVLFEPDDLRVISGSPSRRRDYLDKLIDTIDPVYGTLTRRYDRVLLQRNKLLKTNPNMDAVFAWNVSLAEYGSQIIEKRKQFCKYFNDNITDVYKKISGTEDTISIYYDKNGNIEKKSQILHALEVTFDKDIILGYTTVGPHRHDISFVLNDSPAETKASRGETRSIILALKFITEKIIKQTFGISPLVILDDVFSELDERRQKLTMKYFSESQIISTSTYTLEDSINNIKL